MRTYLLTAVLMLSFLATSFATVNPVSNWDLLGKKRVDFKIEKDVIKVGLVQGLFTAIQLRVKGNDIDMHKLTIYYKNGTKQKVNVRKNIAAGGKTRVINLTGNGRRIIKEIVMYYEKETRANPAVVEVWGRHNSGASSPAPTVANPTKNWDLLGKRNVNFRIEKDVIKVGLVDGLFKAIQLKVKGNDIDMHKLTIYYKNGSKQKVNVRKNIAAGGKTRVINLAGNGRRVIKEVVMYYEKETRANPAVVEVWGRHN